MADVEADKRRTTQGRAIFGSFYLLDSEFALSVSFVQEVVNAPTSYTPVPLSSTYLKGLFNLRGTVVPVIDLKELLGIKGAQAVTDQLEMQKVAIVELNGACVGLLFDRTGEVFKDDGDERSDFDTIGDDRVVGGVFKKDAGKRIVQILDVERLFKLQNVPKDSKQSRLGREALGKRRGNRRQCISFVVGPARCSLPISEIQEILKVERVNESALGFGDCIGTIDLRGTTVPVIDFSALLGYREVDRTDVATQGNRRIVVMRLEKELFGLLVDSIDSIISFFSDELIAFPVVEQKRSAMFIGCITGHGESDILLLDHQKILTDREVSEITRGHSKLYRAADYEAGKAQLRGVRRTYITFKIDGTYAVSIDEVKEIIEYPRVLMHPPGQKPHVKGVLNLRGELVTIVDARSMYLKSTDAPLAGTQKVLVFKRDNLHFGLVVDSVESIIAFADSDKVRLPDLLFGQGDGSMTADISEAVEVIDSHGQKTNMLILSVDALIQRATRTLAA